MNSSDEFTSPIATSTVWKKSKPHDWQQEPETTFQDHDFLSEVGSPGDKENININSNQVGNVKSETTLNLWKYIVPPHPGEMEEDPFIVDNEAYKMDVSTPKDFEQHDFSEKLAQDLANLDILAKNYDYSSKETCTEKPQDLLLTDENFTPIPGYIITEKGVIMRRHSTSTNMKHAVELYDGELHSRKILSAPPSIFIVEPSLSDKENDEEVSTLTSKCNTEPSFGYLIDDAEVEEDLVNESLSKYFQEAPDISSFEKQATISEQEVCLSYNQDEQVDAVQITEKCMPQRSNSPIDKEYLKGNVEDVTQYSESNNDSAQLNSNKRQSMGSSNIVPYIDPENSMTTETLELISPEFDNKTEFELPYSGVEQSENKTEDRLIEEDLVKNEIESESNFAESGFGITEDTGIDDQDIQLTYHEARDPNVLSDDDNTTQEKSDDENVTPETSPKKVWKHPSFNSSPEMHHHTILERILKDDYATGKQIIIPPTLTVEQPCAVGITRKFSIKIENKTDLWVQCNISVDDIGKMNGFSSQNRLIIPPLAEETLPVCLSAKQDGLCLGTVELTVNSVISGMLPEQYHSCKITAIAELPGLTLSPKNISFGIQVDNKEASYELENSSQYELPLKVVLHSEGLDEVFSLSDPMSRYPTAVFALTLAPHQVFVGHLEFCPYEQYNNCAAKLRAYVDCPNGALLAEISISGTVGHYKLQIPADKHSLTFHSSPGEPVHTTITLLNTGNMETPVTLSVSRPFTVTPAVIPSLVPGEEAACEVSYFPVVTEHVTGLLTLSLATHAVIYQVPIEGRSTRTKPPTSSTPPYTLLANKSIVNFGGSDIGRQKEETLILQNDSPTQLMCLVLRIISPSRSFYILNDSSITLSCDMVLPAGSSQSLKLGYTPLHPEQHVGELLVKTKNSNISFAIPLSGHGGVSQVSVLNAQQTSSRLWVDMGDITPNTRNTARITLHNTGRRAAFVSGLLENEDGYLLSSTTAWINPKAFVIPENSSRDMFVIYDPKGGSTTGNRVALLKLYCGDEIARQRFCKVLKILDMPVKEQDLPFDPTIEFLVPGDMVREGQVKVPHICQDDIAFERRLFGSGLYQLFISVMGRTPEGPKRRSLVPSSHQEVSDKNRRSTPSPASNPPSASNPTAINTSDSCVSSSRVNRSKSKSPTVSASQEKAVEFLWSFSVNELQFNKPTVFHIVNESYESLTYEVSYEGTLYDVAPKAGCIPPCGCTEISIRPHCSSRPFISTLLVSAAGTERTLKLSYTPVARDDVNLSGGRGSAASGRSSAVSGRGSTGNDRVKHVPAEDKVVVFQTIPINMSSSAFFEFTNTYGDMIQWKLCSVAPAYRKLADGEPTRVPYSAFCVGVVSGVTPNGAHERIPITFYPKHVGHFTQCWTFIYNTNSLKSLKHNRRVILEGSATARSSTTHSASSTAHSASSLNCLRPKDRIYLKNDRLDFCAVINEHQSLSFKLSNPLKIASKVKLSTLLPPFYLKYKEILVEAGHSARIPMKYKPTTPGVFREFLSIETDQGVLKLELRGIVSSERSTGL